jgi:hypothetical protein
MHYITETLSPLSEWCASDAPESNHKLIVHADSTHAQIARLSVEFLEENRMKPALHPPCSPDIALSDFYLLGYVKGCLAGRLFVDSEELFEATRAVLDILEKVTLQAVFLKWMAG